jgi:hypothetical protein
MSDKGKTAAIEQLRREVGFGCPVCRSPFLTWHHFDPPWHEEEHWRPEGIIAMCPLCHADADEKGRRPGAYSIEELRVMKKTDRSFDDINGHFPAWQNKKRLLVRVGGCYTDTAAPVISINGLPQITIGQDAVGLLSLTFELRNKQDDILVRMEDNWFTAYPRNVHDMIVTPKTKEVTVWLGEEDVGLKFSFRRVTMAELDQVLDQDRKRQEDIVAKERALWLAQLPPDQQRFFQYAFKDASSRRRSPPSWVADLPENERGAFLAEDMTAYVVKQWVVENCVMDDGLIPLLDFEQMAIHFHGEQIMIKDGIAGFLYYSAAFENAKGAINLACHCASCRAMRQATA